MKELTDFSILRVSEINVFHLLFYMKIVSILIGRKLLFYREPSI